MPDPTIRERLATLETETKHTREAVAGAREDIGAISAKLDTLMQERAARGPFLNLAKTAATAIVAGFVAYLFAIFGKHP